MFVDNEDRNAPLLNSVGAIYEAGRRARDMSTPTGFKKRVVLPLMSYKPALIKIVIIKMLSNAVKFTRNAEHAVIEVKPLPAGEPGFMVKDNGAGFDMRYADKLSGVFQRLHSEREFEGIGIGLATVQRIVAKHGRRVWAEAEKDQGAAFYVELSKVENALK